MFYIPSDKIITKLSCDCGSKQCSCPVAYGIGKCIANNLWDACATLYRKLLTPAQFLTGNILGTIGAVIPVSTQASRNQKKVSASKKHCVIAPLTLASNLRLRNALGGRKKLVTDGGFTG